jgi:hypothetical protein
MFLKQLQLIHEQDTFDEERAAWRFVVCYNILQAVQRVVGVICALDYGADSATECNRTRSAFEEEEPSSMDIPDAVTAESTNEQQLAFLYDRLRPLLALRPSLIDCLSNGKAIIDKDGTIAVRQGWQKTVTSNAYGHSDRKVGSSVTLVHGSIQVPHDITGDRDEFLNDISRILEKNRADIDKLLEHPIVKSLRHSGRLRIGDWED